MPGLRSTIELLATLSVGVPIGVGVYFAWVNRDWTTKTKSTGFTVAAGAAVVGAWLGYHATTGLLALITTIVGAAAGANLALIILDIRWDRRARSRVAATTATETLRAQPSSG